MNLAPPRGSYFVYINNKFKEVVMSYKVFLLAIAASMFLLGCDESSTAASDDTVPVGSGSVPQSSASIQDDNTQEPSAGGVVSCSFVMRDVFKSTSCIEAPVAYADSVKMICVVDEVAVASATLGNGCPSGAVQVCSDVNPDNPSEKMTAYFYHSIFASMSCDELMSDEDDFDDDSGDTDDSGSLDDYDLTEVTPVACTYDNICIQTSVETTDPSACTAIEGAVLSRHCASGGTYCDVGKYNTEVYIYSGAEVSCADLQ